MQTIASVAMLAALAGPGAHAPGLQDATHGIITLDLRVPDVPNDAVTALRDRYAAAVNAADAQALGALYAADALVVVADGVVLRGATEVARYYQDAFASRPDGTAVTLSPERFTVENGVASETGTFTESWAADAAGQPATGVYVTIYTRNAIGEWRIAMEVRTRGRDKQLVRW
jgi:uncharacterized protein (TIGR02246 family)